jgi:hypothetical protein
VVDIERIRILIIILAAKSVRPAAAQERAEAANATDVCVGLQHIFIAAPKYDKGYELMLDGPQVGVIVPLNSSARTAQTGGWFFRAAAGFDFYYVQVSVNAMLRLSSRFFLKAGLSDSYIDEELFNTGSDVHDNDLKRFRYPLHNLMLEYGFEMRFGRFLVDWGIQHDIRRVTLTEEDRSPGYPVYTSGDYRRWAVSFSLSWIF